MQTLEYILFLDIVIDYLNFVFHLKDRKAKPKIEINKKPKS